jgi:hypothetical protein
MHFYYCFLIVALFATDNYFLIFNLIIVLSIDVYYSIIVLANIYLYVKFQQEKAPVQIVLEVSVQQVMMIIVFKLFAIF